MAPTINHRNRAAAEHLDSALTLLAIRHCRVAFLCRYAKGAQHDPN